jgi:hypothetical protein
MGTGLLPGEKPKDGGRTGIAGAGYAVEQHDATFFFVCCACPILTASRGRQNA